MMAEKIAQVRMPDGSIREARVQMPDEPAHEPHPEARMSAALPESGLPADQEILGAPLMGGPMASRMAGPAIRGAGRLMTFAGENAPTLTNPLRPLAALAKGAGRIMSSFGAPAAESAASQAAQTAPRIIQPSADMVARIKDPQEVIRIMKASGASAAEIARVLKQAGIDLASSAWK